MIRRSIRSLVRATRRVAPTLVAGLLVVAPAVPAHAFCGFYVAQAGSQLWNESSRVVLVRDGDRTVLTMENDYQGDPSEFAMVVPVPTILAREQIHVGDRKVLDHLDAFTAPRLVEYHDADPCVELERASSLRMMDAMSAPREEALQTGAANGVRIEARYSVGEYDILILSAEESQGLERWLRANGYRVPEGASEVLRSYLRQGLYFFVAKVNLGRHRQQGSNHLRPLQMAYESPRFMLPIRLGMANAKGPQELYVFALSRRGRVEPTNYRTTRLPSDAAVPVFVKDDFPRFYRDLFGHHVEQENMRTVVLEHAWDMAWCDPCAAEPLTTSELRDLGVFWLDPTSGAPASDVFVTRLHVRYDAAGFPEDLVLRETGDRTNFQGRYVMRHAWNGPARCSAARAYRESLPERWEEEARSLASLTGWEIEDIRERMGLDRVPPATEKRSWWEDLWNR
jgi:hypothetical protein